MIGQKLTKILQSLDPEEFRRLKRALSSPYFATNSRLLDLYNYLKKHYPDFEEEKLQKEKLFKKLYPGKPFNNGVLRVLIREFTAVVEDYIMMERLRKDKLQRKKMLVKEFGQRNLYDYFKKGTEELLNGHKNDFIRDTEYFIERISLYQDYCFHPMTNNYQKGDDSLEQLMESLDGYFILAKYRFAQILRNKNTIFRKKANYRFFDEIRKNKDGLKTENEIVQLYELINKLHNTNHEKYFFELKEIFFPIIKKIRRTDCRIIYFIALNFCTRQINIGNSNYFTEQFELYEEGLNNGLLIENSKMSDATFNNIVNAACYKKEFIWAASFIEEYNQYLDEAVRSDALNYSKTLLNFEQKKYNEALFILETHQFSINYQLRIRTWRVVIAYELALEDLGFYEVFTSNVESYKKYLQRNSYFSENNILPFKNHLRLTEKLVKKIRSGDRKKKIKESMIADLNRQNKVVLKRWLLDKIDSL